VKTYLIVAHPDDETIFFSSLMQNKKDLQVICVTNGDADGMGEKRSRDFSNACKAQGQKGVMWDFEDIYEKRLDQQSLQKKLKSLPDVGLVYTHGIIGEYGHPHHQDVSYAVHSVFKDKVMSTSYNCYPDESFKLSKQEFELKNEILSTTYLSETVRFSHIIPVTAWEGFTKVSLDEVSAIYAFMTQKASLKKDSLVHYKWLYEHLLHTFGQALPRLF